MSEKTQAEERALEALAAWEDGEAGTPAWLRLRDARRALIAERAPKPRYEDRSPVVGVCGVYDRKEQVYLANSSIVRRLNAAEARGPGEGAAS